MSLTSLVFTLWGVFGLYWLIAAFSAKRASGRGIAFPPGLLILGAFVVLHGFRINARIYLGTNWGMPMTQKAEPELVTTGPYRFVRHPIYSGLLLAIVGTALASNLYWLIGLLVVGAYFIYSATVEERNMSSTFPDVYPGYREHTKMLIPFVL